MLARKNLGFTLLEVIVTIAIIAILATIAMPSRVGEFNQKKIIETLDIVERYKKNVEQVYRITGEFPKDNIEADIPEFKKIIGNYLQGMLVENGAMHLSLGNKLSQLEGKTITVYPVYVQNSPNSPVSWVCGFDQIPTGMVAAGVNRTNVDKQYLPGRCR